MPSPSQAPQTSTAGLGSMPYTNSPLRRGSSGLGRKVSPSSGSLSRPREGRPSRLGRAQLRTLGRASAELLDRPSAEISIGML
ncbi:hypothetical protein HQ37_01855 [Porphyromonas sp. COT-239 OH1446]|nr:hypothetical protein HQ37_01855 [Porphyromonas sp. COT-239 OH1446]